MYYLSDKTVKTSKLPYRSDYGINLIKPIKKINEEDTT